MYQLTGSIVLYNNDREELSRAIQSFLQTNLDAKLFLIDNSPTNDLKDICKDARVEYIHSEKNVGYGAGNNIAIRMILNETKYHLVLNPDVYFEKGVFDSIYEYMENNPDVGMLSPQVYYPDGMRQPLCKLLPTPYDLSIRRFLPFRKIVQKRNRYYELRFSGYSKIMEAPFLSGCFMFIRAEALKKVGLFDEKIFMYYEDTDLTRRMQGHYKTIFYPSAEIVHSYKGSFHNPRLLMIQIRSAIYYFNKWGWFSDNDRKRINRETVEKIQAMLQDD